MNEFSLVVKGLSEPLGLWELIGEESKLNYPPPTCFGRVIREHHSSRFSITTTFTADKMAVAGQANKLISMFGYGDMLQIRALLTTAISELIY